MGDGCQVIGGDDGHDLVTFGQPGKSQATVGLATGGKLQTKFMAALPGQA
jgi:hypothetical protein